MRSICIAIVCAVSGCAVYDDSLASDPVAPVSAGKMATISTATTDGLAVFPTSVAPTNGFGDPKTVTSPDPIVAGAIDWVGGSWYVRLPAVAGDIITSLTAVVRDNAGTNGNNVLVNLISRTATGDTSRAFASSNGSGAQQTLTLAPSASYTVQTGDTMLLVFSGLRGGAIPGLSTLPSMTGPVTVFKVLSDAMVLEIFGDGHEGDFFVPPGATVVLDHDVFWRNLIFPDGVNSFIDPNGFAIHVSGELRAPNPPTSGFQNFAVIHRDGAPAVGPTPGAGYPCTGTIDGGSGTGGAATGSTGGSALLPTTPGFPNIWPDTWHPGLGGSGGNGAAFPGLPGGGSSIGATVRPPEAGSPDLFSAMRLRLSGDDGTGNYNTSFMGGAGGGAGGPILGGGGGGGGGNIVVIAKSIVNPTALFISSLGGQGGDGTGGGGGGGGGSGGFITIVTYRVLRGATIDVSGGGAGAGVGGGANGSPGSPGTIFPFSFVINS